MGSKRRELAFYFSIQKWYMFLKSTCRGKSDSGVCMTSVLAKRMRLHSADLLFQNMFGRRIRWKSAQRSRILFASTAVMHTPRSSYPLHFDFKNIYHFSEKSNASAQRLFPATLLEQWPKFATSRSRLNYYRTIGSFPHRRIR